MSDEAECEKRRGSGPGTSASNQGSVGSRLDREEEAMQGQGGARHRDGNPLDFLSPAFDAAAALAAAPALVPPDASAAPLDYVAKCRVLLPPELPESLAGQQRLAGERRGSEVRCGDMLRRHQDRWLGGCHLIDGCQCPACNTFPLPPT
jgi:hypothetical protein